MGAYLHIGFIAKATAELPKDLSKEKVNEALSYYYPGDTYNCEVSKSEIIWTLKPEVIQEELTAFAKTFYKDYHGNIKGDGFQKTLAFIQDISASSDWLERAEKEGGYKLPIIDYGYNESFSLNEKQGIYLHTTVVKLGSEGKFMMEEDECTLRFLETCAQKAYAHFKLGKTIRAFVF